MPIRTPRLCERVNARGGAYAKKICWHAAREQIKRCDGEILSEREGVLCGFQALVAVVGEIEAHYFSGG